MRETSSNVERISTEPSSATLSLDREELVLLNNALNEVSRLLPIPAPEFEARMGVTKRSAYELLEEVNEALTGEPPDPDDGPENPLRFMA